MATRVSDLPEDLHTFEYFHPAVSVGTRICDCCLLGAASGLVLTIVIMTCSADHRTTERYFSPLMTQSSPSSTAWVLMFFASDEGSRFSHRISRSNFTVQQWLEPLFFLRGRSDALKHSTAPVSGALQFRLDASGTCPIPRQCRRNPDCSTLHRFPRRAKRNSTDPIPWLYWRLPAVRVALMPAPTVDLVIIQGVKLLDNGFHVFCDGDVVPRPSTAAPQPT